MKRVILLVVVFSCLQNTNGQPEYAITNVTVIPMDRERTVTNQTVLVKNGKIDAMGDASRIRVPGHALKIDGTGKFLLPGLFDMHAHFFYEQGEHVNTCREEVGLMLAKGLTTVRIMAGHPAYLEAKENTRNTKWPGPELFVASPQLVGRWPWPAKFINFRIVDTKENAEQAVRQFKNEGYDQIKISVMVKAEIFEVINRVSKQEGIKVVGHVGPDIKLPAALAAGEQIEHMDEFIDQLLPDTSYNHGQSVSDMNIWRKNAWATVPYLDDRRIPALVKEVKNAGVYVTPTNHFFVSCFGQVSTEEEIRALPQYQFIPAGIIPERWNLRNHYLKDLPPLESRNKYVDLRYKMVNALWKAGVPLMAGSDSPEWFLVQGFAIHDELESFVRAGLPPFAALQTATSNPATFLGTGAYGNYRARQGSRHDTRG